MVSITSIGNRAQIWGSNGTVDTQSLLELELQLMGLKSEPYVQQRGYFVTEKEAWAELQTKMQTFQTSVREMKDFFLENKKKVTLSQEGFASVAASGEATNTTFQLQVSQVATQHKLLGDSKTSSTTALGYNATVKINGKDLVINSAMSLQGLVTAINEGGYGVRANIIGGALTLTSEKTGAANSITLTDASSGLSSGGTVFEDLGIVTSTGAWKNELQQAKDAIIVVEGVTFTQADNTFKNVMNGVDVTALKETTTNINATVQTNVEDQVAQTKKFVEAYNQMVTYLHNVTKKDGVLQGKAAAVNLKRDLGTFLRQTGGTGLYAYDVGISLGKYSKDGANGTLAFDEAKFKSALEQNPMEVRSLLQGTEGMITKLHEKVNETLKDNGTLDAKIEGVDKTIAGIDKTLTRFEEQYERRKEYVIQKYAQFESLMAQLNMQNEFISAQIKAMNASND